MFLHKAALFRLFRTAWDLPEAVLFGRLCCFVFRLTVRAFLSKRQVEAGAVGCKYSAHNCNCLYGGG